MAELLQANWLLMLAALVIGLLVAWWIFVAARRTKVEIEQSDENDGKIARRNQALIDAPPVAGAAANVAGETGQPVEPAPEPAPEAAPAHNAAGDDLRRIKGVGPKLVTMLHEQGVTTFAQIAGWSDADIDRVDAQLGRFQGRIRRDDWVEQARLLQTGDTAAYEAKFGRTA